MRLSGISANAKMLYFKFFSFFPFLKKKEEIFLGTRYDLIWQKQVQSNQKINDPVFIVNEKNFFFKAKRWGKKVIYLTAYIYII